MQIIATEGHMVATVDGLMGEKRADQRHVIIIYKHSRRSKWTPCAPFGCLAQTSGLLHVLFGPFL